MRNGVCAALDGFERPDFRTFETPSKKGTFNMKRFSRLTVGALVIGAAFLSCATAQADIALQPEAPSTAKVVDASGTGSAGSDFSAILQAGAGSSHGPAAVAGGTGSADSGSGAPAPVAGGTGSSGSSSSSPEGAAAGAAAAQAAACAIIKAADPGAVCP
ncbi:hypothetical protein [Nocardia sp. NPDC051570]|uniref:hypothetical protein n=1 Tax=Nocardia sp. NPDC051570 TaxID=3364324 RepID=UPI0037AA886C